MTATHRAARRPGTCPTPRSRPGPSLAAALLFALAGASTGASGQMLADPTRPPLAITPAAAAAAAAAAREPALVAEPALPPPQLQALKLPQQGAAMALVDGQWLGLGDQVQGRRVLAIDRDGLLLQGKSATERLPLLAGTPKQAPGSIVVNRSTAYVPQAATDPAATGHAGNGMPAADRLTGQSAGQGQGVPPGHGPAQKPGQAPARPPGQETDKTQPMSVAGRNPP